MKTIKLMLQQIQEMKNGLLRFKENDQNLSLAVEAIKGNEEGYEWALTEDPDENLINKQINLIQKQGDDYIYITGFVSRQKSSIKTIVTIQMLKACWMIRKVKGNVTWLEENFIYERNPATLRAAS